MGGNNNNILSPSFGSSSSFVYSFVIIFLLFQSYVEANPACVLRAGKYSYDLSPLTREQAYEANGRDGNNFYFFNFCNRVAQGACTPHQAVCQVGDAPHGCGSVEDVTLVEMKDKEGVRLVYNGGEQCGATRKPRSATVNVTCDPSVDIQVIEAYELNACNYTVEVKSKYGCRVSVADPIPSQDDINIYVVIHSHDDVGWLSTVQGYYDEKVHSILDNIYKALLEDPARKFIQVEIAFFEMWWKTLPAEDKAKVKTLVDSRQLSFAIGGWVMPDEAGPTYSSLIGQLMDGHQFIYKHFNYTPDVGWQIDPFGASTVMAEIYKRSNFKGHVIDRINFRQKNEMQTNKSLQFSWQLSSKPDDDILTHILDTNYCYPFIMGFSIANEISLEQIKYYANYLVDIAKSKAQWTLTPNVLIPIGCDFSYFQSQHAHYQYKAMDQIFQYIRNNSKEFKVATVQYSNVSDYFDALQKSEAPFSVHTGDFMPYNDKDNAWWTGYYTSRPALKGLIRTSEALLRATESLVSTAKIFSNYDDTNDKESVAELSHAIGVNLHHDAITGTAKVRVVDDYNSILEKSRPKNIKLVENMMESLSSVSSLSFVDSVSLDQINNADLNGKEMVVPVVVYNSLGWTRTDYVKLSLKKYNPSFTYVVSLGDQVTPSQILKNQDTDEPVLYFKVVLPPLGHQTYLIKRIAKEAVKPKQDSSHTISNKFLQVSFSDKSNIMTSVTANKKKIDFQQNFMAYDSYIMPNGENTQNSGAYIFRPAGDCYFLDNLTNNAKASWDWSSGDFVSEVYQIFDSEPGKDSFVKQSIRVFNDDDEYLGNFLELSMNIGPIPEDTEIITKFLTSLETKDESYTDSNGFRFLKRKYNKNLYLPIPGNYYPTVYASYITSEDVAIGFIFERQHGFSSSAGAAEVMLHRRCTHDDARGVGDPLNDATAINPVIRVIFSTPKDIMKLLYRHIYLMNFPPIVALSSPVLKSDWISKYKNNTKSVFSMLNGDMPSNIHIVDLKPTETDNTFLLRMAHLYDYKEHPTLSEIVKLPAHSIFAAPFCLSSLSETSITANSISDIHDMNRENYTLTFEPKEMKTFLATIIKDFDYCARGACKNGKCINIPCSGFTCVCDVDFYYDSSTQSCLSNSVMMSEDASSYEFAKVIPVAFLAYFYFVISFMIHSELKKNFNSSSSFFILEEGRRDNTTKRSKRIGIVGRAEKLLERNGLFLESMFLPENLQNKK